MSRHIIKQEDISEMIIRPELGKTDEELAEEAYVNNDHPDTMENGTATLLYIIIMSVGAIFIDRWLIWIISSVIYCVFIKRRKIRKKKWDSMQEKTNGGRK